MKPVLLFLVAALLLPALPAAAQYVVDYQRAADTYFEHKEYYAAAQYYQKALDLLPAPATETTLPFGKAPSKSAVKKQANYEQVVFRLAESLRLYKDFMNAEKWYGVARSFKNAQYHSAAFWYAVCLRANQKFGPALSAFEQYLATTPASDPYRKRANEEIADCKFAIRELAYPKLLRVTRLAGQLNSAGSNYAPAFAGNTLYFTSSRPVNVDGKKEYLSGGEGAQPRIAKKESPYVNSIYLLSGDPGQPANSVQRLDLIKDLDLAAPSFTPSGDRMYFTAWKSEDDKGKRNIYTAQRNTNGVWSEPVKAGAAINQSGFNAIQPFVTRDGKFLMFSSDRPGGFGKYDLWFCKLNPDGSAGPASNMGPAINTGEDEQAPCFIASKNKLIYSSNGKIGIGGFDFYETTGSFEANTWKDAVNKGYPFNSSKDDLYFTAVDEAGTRAYISSDRESLCCLELFLASEASLAIGGKLIDCVSGKPLAGATVTLRDSTDKTEIGKVTTDVSGNYRFRLTNLRPVVLAASKTSYFTKTFNYHSQANGRNDTLVDPAICLETYKVNAPIVLKDVFYEFGKYELTASSKQVLNRLVKTMNDNASIRVEIGSHTDNVGTEAFNQELSLRRAESCVNYLVSQGIEASRLTSKGYGESMPVAPNTLRNGKDNPEGRQRNRRTEFKVLDDRVAVRK